MKWGRGWGDGTTIQFIIVTENLVLEFEFGPECGDVNL